jgi:hypothetical protein
MLRFYNHSNTIGLESFEDGIGNLPGHPFLKLGTPGKYLYHPGQLAYPYYLAIGARDIAYMGYAIKREEMMFTHRIKRDIPQNHHFVVPFLKAYC